MTLERLGARPAPAEAEEVLAFWFGDLDEDGLASPAQQKRWFTKDPEFDREIEDRFGVVHVQLLEDFHRDWQRTPRGRLAAVIVLDQFSRNMYRDTPGMFVADPIALAMTNAALEAGEDTALRGDQRAFLYMPLMHAEDLAAQDRCVALFQAWHDASDGRLRERLALNLHFAILHRDIVARFGRFPHRNENLGRTSTPEELAFLQEPNSSF